MTGLKFAKVRYSTIVIHVSGVVKTCYAYVYGHDDVMTGPDTLVEDVALALNVNSAAAIIPTHPHKVYLFSSAELVR